MTAEVGVMNRIGIALAADSAVSIGRDADKIYTSADKLFQLSKSAPVGIMVYGNADFLGIPWETIVKEYRQRLASRRFDSIQEYANSLIDFIRDDHGICSKDLQDQSAIGLVYSLFLYVRDVVEDRITEIAEAQNGLEESDISTIIDEIVSNHLKVIKGYPLLDGIDSKERAKVRSRLKQKLTDVTHDIYGNLPISNQAKKSLHEIAVEMLTRHYFGPLRAGIVIAGFGEQEYMPRLFSYDIEEMVAGHPRLALLNDLKITPENSAAILPFAQQEMVHSFLQGIDPALDKFIKESTTHTLYGLLRSVVEVFSEDLKIDANELEDVIQTELQTSLDKLFQSWGNQCNTYWRPVLEIVSALPKDELAAMAEAFVNLTKFRRRITPERETVGGPIDVAVITKGDGFIWVKRKHYFDSELNPRVMARFLKEF